jgi:diguanylate cyclase (GGDEF)-like protein/PAS domain S-box-containing protein
MDGLQGDTAQRAIVWLRWLGMILGLTQVYLAQPPPVSRAAAVATTLAMAAYNSGVIMARRVGRWERSLPLAGLLCDFLACTTWVMLVANDRYSTAYAVFALVAIEAGVLYQRRGAALFSAGFAVMFVALYWVREHFFGFPAEPGSMIFRASIILLVAALIGAVATQSQRRRRELERQTAALRKSEERFRSIADNTSIGVAVADGSGRLVSTNRAYQALVGYSHHELARMQLADFTHPDDIGASARLAAEVASGVRTHDQLEKRWIGKNGEVSWVRINASHMPGEPGGPGFVIAIVEDISERKRNERLRSLQFAVTRCLAEAATLTDAASVVLQSIGEALGEEMGRLFLTDPTGRTLELRHTWQQPSCGPRPGDRLAATFTRGDGLQSLVWATGRTVTIAELSGDASLSDPGVDELRDLVGFPIVHDARVIGVVTLGSRRTVRQPEPDVVATLSAIGSQIGQFIERKKVAVALQDTAERLATLAGTDPLTGLANRREFERRLEALQERGFAVLAIDVDGLKAINDIYGHDAGDAALRAIGTALRMGIREQDTVARTGGDEFVALLLDVDAEQAAAVAERLRTSMYGIALARGQARLSIGCAAGAAGTDPNSVWAMADEALYGAKLGGRDRSEVSAGPHTGPASSRSQWERSLPALIASQGMHAIYQPIVELGTGRALAYEALCRPVDGPLDAGVEGLFAAAHQLGLGRDLDWVCRRAILRNSHELPRGRSVFINVGASPLLDPVHDVDQMLLLLRSAGRAPEEVVLEITEREAVRDLERLREVVAAYRAEGFRFALDDVGEGYSTFDALVTVIPEFIKVGGRLTRRCHERGPRAAIEALVTFAASTATQVIAEGLETDDSVDAVRELGVSLGQGFVLARPAEAGWWREAVEGPDPPGMGTVSAGRHGEGMAQLSG